MPGIVAKYLLVVLISVLLLLLGCQVVLRYGFNIGLIWVEEASRILFLWSVFLGLFLSYERGEIPAVQLFQDALPARLFLVSKMLINSICIVFLMIIAYYGYTYASRIGGQPIPSLIFLLGEGNAPSMFWVLIALPVGFVLLAARMGLDVVRCALLLLSGSDAHPFHGEHGGGTAL